MRGLHKSKRVAWAADFNLCQVRLFLSEDTPSQVGFDSQDNLQAKTSWLLHSNGTSSEDILPPGFEGGAHPANQLQIRLTQIPVNQWTCPPRFRLNFEWQVVTGEESEEVEVQNQREMRVLEAVYPRSSSIPPNPSFPVDSEDSVFYERHAPLIPITPIEDEDVTADPSSDSIIPFNVPINPSTSQCSVPSSIVHSSASDYQSAAGASITIEPDVVAAASVALDAIMKRDDQGNLIDPELLVNILSNPKMIKKLVTDLGTATNTPSIDKPTLPPVPLSDSPAIHINRTENSAPSLAPLNGGTFYTQPNVALSIPNPRPPPPSKDINYYKSLIQQHGGERQEIGPQFGNRHNHQWGANPESANSYKSRDPKMKIMKPCIYFNSSRGCRHGANCAYQHDAAFQQGTSGVPELQSAKRMKVDR